MLLNRLSILNYKNIAEATLDFCGGINCFVGNNGVGKTNLLDSVYYLACTKSRTGLMDSLNVRHGEQFFMIQGEFYNESSDNAPVLIQAGYKVGGRKNFKNCGKDYQRLADHIGLIPVVIVSPSDSNLIEDWSDNRRKFIDSVISQYSKEYLFHLIKYNALLSDRNSYLKQETDDEVLYEACEAQMAESGRYIYEARCKFTEEFAKVFKEYYAKISMDKEQVELEYKSHLATGDLKSMLEYSRKLDLIVGHTTKGVHKDDLDMLLGGYSIKKVGSQGQNKSFLLALKFAQFNYLKRITGRTPILLLDDIFDKLDAERVERIVSIVSGDEFGQIFITDTNRDNLDALIKRASGGEYRIFKVTEGEVKDETC